MKGILKKGVGVLCILAGILLGFVPLIPGIVLVVIGLDLLGAPIVPWERVTQFKDRFWKKKPTQPPEEE